MSRDNLYTDGAEFMLPNGEMYVGYYHVHITGGAMIGRSHTTEPHEKLRGISDAVRSMVQDIQAQLSEAQGRPTSINPTPRGSSSPASSY